MFQRLIILFVALFVKCSNLQAQQPAYNDSVYKKVFSYFKDKVWAPSKICEGDSCYLHSKPDSEFHYFGNAGYRRMKDSTSICIYERAIFYREHPVTGVIEPMTVTCRPSFCFTKVKSVNPLVLCFIWQSESGEYNMELTIISDSEIKISGIPQGAEKYMAYYYKVTTPPAEISAVKWY